MSHMSAGPFLKWPGGKRWLTGVIAGLICGRLQGTYYEPFVGSGAVYYALAPDRAVLSDANSELIECLTAVRDEPVRVLARIWQYSNSEECYYTVRSARPKTLIGKAARFIYLNKTCWGGLYRSNQRGEFNVPFGYSGREVCKKHILYAAAAALQNVRILCSDFEPMILQAGHGDVVYADPPYTTLGQNNGFVRYNERIFAWKDQERLAKACRAASDRGARVIVSGIWHESVLALYPGWQATSVSRHSTVSRCASGRKPVLEVLLSNK